jgi:hypothetical protein
VSGHTYDTQMEIFTLRLIIYAVLPFMVLAASHLTGQSILKKQYLTTTSSCSLPEIAGNGL